MAEENTDKLEKSLTGILHSYTLAADSGEEEVESIMIKQFLDSLADIALSAASRKGRENQ